MANKQRFAFTSNSLSKGNYLKGFFNSALLQSKKKKRQSLKLLADFFQVKKEQIFLFGAGRMSVFTLIKSLQIRNEDEVIVAGYTCVVLTNAVKFTGCQVRYVDITTSTANLDTNALLSAISPKTKMIIVSHNFGLPYSDISMIKEMHPNIIILEDAAHTFGSKSDDKLCGTIGDAGFFSLEYSKPITSGLGGIIVINNTSLLPAFKHEFDQLEYMSKSMERKLIATLGTYNLNYFKNTTFFYRFGVKVLRTLRMQYKTSSLEVQGEQPENYPVKMSRRLTCFLVPQLKRIEQINAVKIQLVKNYIDAFKQFSDLEHLPGENQVLVRYPLLFKESVPVHAIESIKKEGVALGLNFGVWFNDVVHPAGSYRYCYTTGDCPQGESIAARMLNLPVNANYSNMSKEIKEVVALFKKHGIK